MKNEVVARNQTGKIKALVKREADLSKSFGFILVDGTVDGPKGGLHFNWRVDKQSTRSWNSTCPLGLKKDDRVMFDIVLDAHKCWDATNIRILSEKQPQAVPTTAAEDTSYAKAAQALSKEDRLMQAAYVGVQTMSEGDEDLYEDYSSDDYDSDYEDEDAPKKARNRQPKKVKKEKKGEDDDE